MAILPRLQQFDVAQGIAIRDNARNRYLDDQKQSALQRIGQLAASGDMSAASGEAFRSGQLDIGARIRQMSQEEQAQLVDDAASWAYSAQTPEAWEAGRPMWEAKGFDVGDFSTRDQLISRAMTVKEQMQLQMQRDNAARAQANADRSYGLQREALDFRKSQASADAQPPMASPTGNPIADREYFKSVGKQAAERDMSRPQTIQKAQDALATIEKVKNHPGLNSAIGGFQGRVPALGGAQADAIALIEQLQGKAFLEAFESLKGGGQITQIEGEKATNAIARLQRTQTEDGFREALDDLASVVRAGLERAQGGQGGMQTGLPQPGMVEDGYRFLGGDPANPNSWEPAQ